MAGPLSFELAAGAPREGARTGLLHTPHGTLQTPVFFPVGTYGAVRGISPRELTDIGAQGVLANTYHLWLRPGEDVVRQLGGLQRFIGWSGPMLTDSGGFQVHSLDHLAKKSEDGVTFRNPIDGERRFLSPEVCIAIQEALGADLIMPLDEFEPIALPPDAAEAPKVRAMLERTLRWAERCRAAQTRDDQWLFGIVQGGGFEDLRSESAERTSALGFDAFAIGGLGVGEDRALRTRLLRAALRPLPDTAPRYLMGLGTPEDLVDAIECGVDVFDCVVPTRNGRHGVFYTHDGRKNLRNARYREQAAPLERGCRCPACAGGFSAGYLHHLFKCQEALGPRLVSLHNLSFYMKLLEAARRAIGDGRFTDWARGWRERYSASSSSSATDSAA